MDLIQVYRDEANYGLYAFNSDIMSEDKAIQLIYNAFDCSNYNDDMDSILEDVNITRVDVIEINLN